MQKEVPMSVFGRKSVLVPVDYSGWSTRAVRVARSIAESDTDVTVMYVAQDYDLTLHPMTWTGGPLPNYREERLLQGLQNWLRENNLGDVKRAVSKVIRGQRSANSLRRWTRRSSSFRPTDATVCHEFCWAQLPNE